MLLFFMRWRKFLFCCQFQILAHSLLFRSRRSNFPILLDENARSKKNGERHRLMNVTTMNVAVPEPVLNFVRSFLAS